MRDKSDFQILAILSPSIILRALAMDIFLPCLPTVANQFNAPLSVAQWVLSIYFIGAGLGQLIIGPLADRFGRRAALFASVILFALSSLACANASSLNMLIFTRLFQGVGACGTTVVTMAIIRDIFEDHHTPRIYSYVNSVISLAPILAPLLGGILLMLTGSWRTVFYFVTVFSIIALVISYYYVSETNPRFLNNAENAHHKHINFLHAYRQVLTNRDFYSYVLCAISCFTGLFLFFSSSSVLLIDIMGVEPDLFGIYFGLNASVYLIGSLISPKLQKLLKVNHMIMLGSACILLGGICMLLINIYSGMSVIGFLAPNMLQTFGVGLCFGPCMAGAMRAFKHIAGVASAAYGAMLYCLSALFVTAIMQLQTISFYPLAITFIVFGALNLIVMHRLGHASYAGS